MSMPVSALVMLRFFFFFFFTHSLCGMGKEKTLDVVTFIVTPEREREEGVIMPVKNCTWVNFLSTVQILIGP